VSDPQKDLDLSPEDHYAFVREISSVFRQHDAVWLLRLIGFDPRDIPDFRPENRVADWNATFNAIDSGTLATPTPYRDLLHQALKRRPGNTELLRIKVAASSTTGVRRVHVLRASPRDRERLRGDLKAIETAAEFGHIIVTGSTDAEFLDLRALLKPPRPDILHVSSHGEGRQLVFEDIYGEADAVPAARVVELLSTYRDNANVVLSGVVLNSCGSSEIAADFHSVSDVVIAHKGPLDDPCAALFSGELYTTLRAVPGLAGAARIAADHCRATCPQLRANLITLGGDT
jgi:hypothetical protein